MLTGHSYMDMQRRQSERRPEWPESGGYVDGVVDDRDSDYIRFYCGQSGRLVARIQVDHSEAIRAGHISSLHYFVLARGLGYRSGEFLCLWSSLPLSKISGGSATEAQKLARVRCRLMENVLEMTFCRACWSLSGFVFTAFFGPGEYANVGLNNLPLLFEGGDLSAFIRSKYSVYHWDFLDPDNRNFVGI